jgi:hypothetical protein
MDNFSRELLINSFEQFRYFISVELKGKSVLAPASAKQCRPLLNFSSFVCDEMFFCLLRAYGLQKGFISKVERLVDDYQQAYFPSIVANRWLSIQVETLGNLIIFCAALLAVLGKLMKKVVKCG